MHDYKFTYMYTYNIIQYRTISYNIRLLYVVPKCRFHVDSCLGLPLWLLFCLVEPRFSARDELKHANVEI
jgi:hypothetical protein